MMIQHVMRDKFGNDRGVKMMNLVLKTPEFCIKQDEFCIKNDEFCSTRAGQPHVVESADGITYYIFFIIQVLYITLC